MQSNKNGSGRGFALLVQLPDPPAQMVGIILATWLERELGSKSLETDLGYFTGHRKLEGQVESGGQVPEDKH